MSSTNLNILILISFFPTFILFRSPSLSIFSIAPDRTLATIRKRKGASGSHCLSHFSGLNSLVGLPFTRTDRDDDPKQPVIHLIHIEQKPRFSMTYTRYSPLTDEIICFLEIYLYYYALLLFLFTSSITSLTTNTLSNKSLLSKKVDCLIYIILCRAFFSPLQIIFKITLYTLFTQEIDLYSFY